MEEKKKKYTVSPNEKSHANSSFRFYIYKSRTGSIKKKQQNLSPQNTPWAYRGKADVQHPSSRFIGLSRHTRCRACARLSSAGRTRGPLSCATCTREGQLPPRRARGQIGPQSAASNTKSGRARALTTPKYRDNVERAVTGLGIRGPRDCSIFGMEQVDCGSFVSICDSDTCRVLKNGLARACSWNCAAPP